MDRADFGQLRAYITYFFMQDQCNIWIAQKKVEQKDGLIKQDLAIIKMFLHERRKRRKNRC